MSTLREYYAPSNKMLDKIEIFEAINRLNG